MPVTYTIDPSNRLIHTVCAGPITANEVIDHFRELAQDPSCPDCLDVLLEVQASTSAPESADLRDVTAAIAHVRSRVKFGACAIVATTDLLFGMMRMFEVFTEQYFNKTQVFRDLQEAEAWLMAERACRPGNDL